MEITSKIIKDRSKKGTEAQTEEITMDDESFNKLFELCKDLIARLDTKEIAEILKD